MMEDRGSLHPFVDTLGGILSNPVVLEGLIAGITALSASRRTKNAKAGGEVSTPADGLSLSGMIDMLPSILPLLSMFSGSGTQAASADAEPQLPDAEPLPDESVDDIPSLTEGVNSEPESAVGADAFGGDYSVSYESPESQRENLLLAIRPFLSESRRSAADAMVQVNKLSGLFRSR